MELLGSSGNPFDVPFSQRLKVSLLELSAKVCPETHCYEKGTVLLVAFPCCILPLSSHGSAFDNHLAGRAQKCFLVLGIASCNGFRSRQYSCSAECLLQLLARENKSALPVPMSNQVPKKWCLVREVCQVGLMCARR